MARPTVATSPSRSMDRCRSASGGAEASPAAAALFAEAQKLRIDISPLDDEGAAHEKVVHVHQLINMYRVRGHLLANLDPLGRRVETETGEPPG